MTSAVSGERLLATNADNDSEGREKRKGKNDRLTQMEKGEGRDRAATDRRGCRGSCRDTASPSHTREVGATGTASFYRLLNSRQ